MCFRCQAEEIFDMRAKLQKFTAFTNTLLPHETAYLLRIERFEDPIRRDILKQVDYNCRNINQFSPYDESLDKRKYSNLKNWIVERLKAIDVDEHFEWMSNLEKKISTDSITPEEEKQLLKTIRRYEHPSFYFTKFYELIGLYRHFLQIRMRYSDHQMASDFLAEYQAEYNRSIQIDKQMHLATQDIVGQYAKNNADSKHWEQWITEVFEDESLDGKNRYMALVRLIFNGFNYRKFEPLISKFDYLDELFKQGKYYSKRLLLNYYSNRLLLHSKFDEFDKAAYYGYLSIRAKNHDFLFYSTNLGAVLLRQNKAKEALEVMKGAYPEMKTTHNIHNKVGFVAFYMKCLNQNGRYKNAENYGNTFLRAYRKEIMDNRWHIFFSSYIEALLQQEEYRKIIKLVRHHRLLDRERQYQQRANYLPTLLWYHAVAEYKEMQRSESELHDLMAEFMDRLQDMPSKHTQCMELLQQLRPHIPKTVNRLRESFKQFSKPLSQIAGSVQEGQRPYSLR